MKTTVGLPLKLRMRIAGKFLSASLKIVFGWDAFKAFAVTQEIRTGMGIIIMGMAPSPELVKKMAEDIPDHWGRRGPLNTKPFRWWDPENKMTTNEDMVVRSC